MTEKFRILGQYIKDMSSETKDTETYIFVKDKISKYQLNININSKPLKNKMVEINTILKFEDKEETTHNKVDISEKELEEFINSLTGEQFEGVVDFFNTMPKVQHAIEVTNPNTKKKGEVVIEGIESFFE